jgi:hypothetical protein
VADINIGYEELVNTQVVIHGPYEDFVSFTNIFVYIYSSGLKLCLCITQKDFIIFLLRQLNLAQPCFSFLYACWSNSNFRIDVIVTSL